MDGEAFFHGAGRGGAGRGQGGEYTVYTKWLKSHATAKDILIHIASSEISQICSTFMIFIVIMISITIIVIIIIIIAIIINSIKDDIWDMNELFHKLTNFGEQSSKPC